MKSKLKIWIKSAVAAVVSGASNAALASLGIAGANAVGIKVVPLDWSQIWGVCVSGAFVGLLLYLKQSPVPPSDDTEFVRKA